MVEMVQIIHIVEATSVMLVEVVVEAVIITLLVLEYMVVDLVVRPQEQILLLELQTLVVEVVAEVATMGTVMNIFMVLMAVLVSSS